MERLKALHPIFIALGAALGGFGLAGLPAGSRAQTVVVALGGAFGTFGGVLARYFVPTKPADVPAPEVKP